MQEGTQSLMQMAKVSVAVDALRRESLPFISVLDDPTYGGVSASYAMQADVRIAVSPNSRIGFAGPQVILNTMCEQNQEKFDKECPADFQSATYVAAYGQLDMILENSQNLERVVGEVASLLTLRNKSITTSELPSEYVPTEEDMNAPFNYTRSRSINRPQTQDIISNIFQHFVELYGDGKVGRDKCIRGGIASFSVTPDSSPIPCVVIATYKGHTPKSMLESNYGMPSPHGYRTALRLMQLAERFHLPVVTLIDTVGAWPSFEAERDGQSEAIATNLTAMAGLKVPIVTILVGEGGSGGALGIGMGNRIGMISGGYFGVISPEGAASILGRYKNEVEKALQFPKDCQSLAIAQRIYAYQLKEIGIVDDIIWEKYNSTDESTESYTSFPVLGARLRHFIANSLSSLLTLNEEGLIADRYGKFRGMGVYDILSEEDRANRVKAALERANAGGVKKKEVTTATSTAASKIIQFIAQTSMNGDHSRYRKLAPSSCPLDAPQIHVPPGTSVGLVTAKSILDTQGPEALALWVRQQTKVLITDTTMRDAHQSLLATRVRTEDLVKGAHIANSVLATAFSLECWGGATFDVSMRFLDECPWKRLREIREACPNICLQMLVRGSNAVGYTSYPDNVVAEFIRLAAKNGMDIFRIFDCFNDVDSMKVSIDAVRAAGKVAEVCLCYTGNLLTSTIYDVEYYKDVAKRAVEAGAHLIGIKDMAGLLRPLEAEPLITAIRGVIPADMPIHFHTHATSSGSIATIMEMSRHGCDIIDVCTASMADGTSQPSMNTFVAMVEGGSRDTGLNYLDLETYDMYWAKVRDMYRPFESGMLSGSARVYEHQIPGGQYSNLIVQCQAMGLWHRWEEVLNAYRDSNRVLGDIIKVTPSSKCVGDLALYLVTRNLSADDLLDESKASTIDFPESVVGLMRGDLGFPHRGFPSVIEKAVLRGEQKRTIRAGLTLPPADLQQNLNNLITKWPDMNLTEEDGMSSLMYPKVFADYMKSLTNKGGDVIRYLPTPVYLYGMVPGQAFTASIPSSVLSSPSNPPNLINISNNDSQNVEVSVKLERITSLKNGSREFIFTVNGAKQVAVIKDTSNAFVFEGPMATAGNPKEIASPMPGAVEKVLVKAGQNVSAGDILVTISAMKMEVKVTAPQDGVVKELSVDVGTRVIEGALLVTLG
eukprot:CAMPEP_0174824330 /NCGR_PEP_ID=MMETSP1107-20130205/33192_1 /TAXON_ID=36770 /ORGANISM="Paraphysomonas vestita, Strain GFlagA" /LENGTH=1169 /DNA_ID=CAMNT_0016051125 /DNA_START=367 /DNA_END=3876 /DNA_ORIENTATION=+